MGTANGPSLVPNWEMTKKISAPRLEGRYSARDALNRLLEGTPLTGVWTTDKAVTIREKKQTDGQTIRNIEGAGVRRLLQATDAEPGGSGRSDAGTGVGSASDAESQSRIPGWRQKSVERNENELRFLEHVVVTGSHIRGVSNTSPVTVLNRAYIDSIGVTTTSRLIESLPQNFALTNQAGVLVPGSSDTGEQGSSINLRAVGGGHNSRPAQWTADGAGVPGSGRGHFGTAKYLCNRKSRSPYRWSFCLVWSRCSWRSCQLHSERRFRRRRNAAQHQPRGQRERVWPEPGGRRDVVIGSCSGVDGVLQAGSVGGRRSRLCSHRRLSSVLCYRETRTIRCCSPADSS